MGMIKRTKKQNTKIRKTIPPSPKKRLTGSWEKKRRETKRTRRRDSEEKDEEHNTGPGEGRKEGRKRGEDDGEVEEEEEKEEEAWRKEGGRYGAAWPKEEGGEAQGITLRSLMPRQICN